jgi:crotonobetainyl-CoA:carnitine CoA-transferase CaiB-like acyl-CoA transferase
VRRIRITAAFALRYSTGEELPGPIFRRRLVRESNLLPMLDLKRFRALDLTDLQGQFAGKILADLGMEVIKIEPPTGDAVRRLPPFKGKPPDPEASLPFLYLNSNKKSVSLNLEVEEGRQLLKGLVRRSDVLLESFTSGHLHRLGLGYDALARENPALVMTSITAFGLDGPHAHFLGSDLIGLAMGGLLNVFGESSRTPVKPPESQAFFAASAYAALGALFALFRRSISGRGQHVDVSVQESLAVEDQILSSFANERLLLRRDGAQHKQVSPANVFPCQDGYVYLFVSASAGHWKKFLELWEDHPKMFDAPDWESPGYRRQNSAVINEAVVGYTKKFRRAELVQSLQSNGLPCLPVNTPLEFLQDEQIQARGFLQAVKHPRWGTYSHPGTPFFIDGGKLPITAAPGLGEHNAEVYQKLLNLQAQDMETLRTAKVI